MPHRMKLAYKKLIQLLNMYDKGEDVPYSVLESLDMYGEDGKANWLTLGPGVSSRKLPMTPDHLLYYVKAEEGGEIGPHTHSDGWETITIVSGSCFVNGVNLTPGGKKNYEVEPNAVHGLTFPEETILLVYFSRHPIKVLLE